MLKDDLKCVENCDDLFISNGDNGENVFDIGIHNDDIDDDDAGVGIVLDMWADNQFIPELVLKLVDEFDNIDADEGCNIELVRKFKSDVALTSTPMDSLSGIDIFLSDINNGGGSVATEGILSKNCDIGDSLLSLDIGGIELLSLSICDVMKPSNPDILLVVSNISRLISDSFQIQFFFLVIFPFSIQIDV